MTVVERPLRSPSWVATIVLIGAIAACNSQVAERQGEAGRAVASAAPRTDFADLIDRLSEPGGFFDTDNLISNEASYLHVMGKMREMGVTGGAYLGVGPDQNFSYVAQIRPTIAFMVDIRRDNLLQHLMFKALFELSHNRIEYLAMLLGRPAPDDASAWDARPLDELTDYIDATPAHPARVAEYQRAIAERLPQFGLTLSASDVATIQRFHRAFIEGGLGLRFTSFNRAPRPGYPSFGELLLESDLTGKRANYLADESDFQFIRSMQEQDRIVPVVGNLAGTHAVDAIGEYLVEIGEYVSAVYTSNVEFYVMRDRTFDRFADNVARLPRNERSVIIRSYFGGAYRFRPAQAVPGYLSVQLLQTMQSFAEDHAANGYRSYLDVVTKHSLPLR